MNRYQWREHSGPTPKISADVFGGVVENLANGQPPYTVSPEDIVSEARKRTSPIHKLFTWDDAKAAESYRCQQARHFLGMLEIVVVEQRAGRSTSSRAFYTVNVGKRGYMARDRVLSDRDLRLQVIASAKRELETYLAKYGAVLRLGNYIPRLNDVIGDMQSEINRLSEAATKPKKTSKRIPAEEAHVR